MRCRRGLSGLPGNERFAAATCPVALALCLNHRRILSSGVCPLLCNHQLSIYNQSPRQNPHLCPRGGSLLLWLLLRGLLLLLLLLPCPLPPLLLQLLPLLQLLLLLQRVLLLLLP